MFDDLNITASFLSFADLISPPINPANSEV